MVSSAPEDLYLSADDLSEVYGVPKGTLQRWASVDGWRRTQYATPTRYLWSDADASFHKYRAA